MPTGRHGGRKVGESAATDLPGSATAVLARWESRFPALKGLLFGKNGYVLIVDFLQFNLFRNDSAVVYVNAVSNRLRKGTP